MSFHAMLDATSDLMWRTTTIDNNPEASQWDSRSMREGVTLDLFAGQYPEFHLT